MTADDERSDDELEDTTDTRSSGVPSDETPGSRFDKFLDRLDERNEKRDPSETTVPDGEKTEPKTDAEPETDLEGWVWGPSKRPGGVDPASGSAGSRPDREEGAISPGFEPVGDRIWNEVSDDELIGDPADRESAGEQSATGGDGTASNAEEPPSEGDPEETSESAGRSESTEKQDRWAELGASLGKAKSDKGTAETDRRTDLDDSEGLFGDTEERPDSGADEPSWGAANSRTTTSEGGSGETSIVSGSRSAELDRAMDAGSVLVLGPTDHPVSDAICSRALVGEDGSRDVLFVTFDGSVSERINVVRNVDGWSDGEIGIIKIGSTSRSAAAASETTSGIASGSITVREVSNPGNLSRIGIVITQLLSKFDTTPRRTVLCFDSLSSLHNQIGTKTLFRFLNTLQGRLASEDTLGYYHMDPELHDEIVIETLRPIFDSVIRYSAEGELEIE